MRMWVEEEAAKCSTISVLMFMLGSALWYAAEENQKFNTIPTSGKDQNQIANYFELSLSVLFRWNQK